MSESTVILIHPLDLCELLNSGTGIKDAYVHEKLLEIDGKFYKQTVEVPAHTKAIS